MIRNRKTRILAWLASHAGVAAPVAFAGTMLGADCQGNIVQDPTFRDWCGDALCAWHTDHGQIQRVPTWDPQDFGVSFLDGSEISQVTEESQATCILFTSVGDIAPSAQMTVSVDFDNDGTVDYTAPLGAATWQKVQAEISAPPAYTGITFHVSKNGTGTAILAEMRIQETTGCTATAPTLQNLGLGETCSSTSECAAGLVCPGQSDAGISVCSQCDDAAPCGGGVACARWSVFLPGQCGPGKGLGSAGAPCVAGSDCASGKCDGARAVSLRSDDAGTCNLDALGDSTASPDNCSWFTALGGTCH
jgi:hypothetical protein